MVLGNVAERLGQSVIVGYLIAGTLVGPHGLGWILSHAELLNIAEIGVSLLLFTIGLEFSAARLRALGISALKIGPWQVVLTATFTYAGCHAFGVAGREALVIGMMIAMSSTACVLRLLTDRAEIETRHGRSALGILLFQDAAVVPMILLVSVLATGAPASQVLWKLALALLAAAALLGAFYVLFNVIAPRIFLLPTYRRNRDLPILLAVIMATGSAWATHAVGLSPALGAFAAGILLATSPFAVQIRADTRPLMTVMVTLFFAAIGLFGDPVWLVAHWMTVTAVVLAIIVGKPFVIAVLSRIFGEPWRYGVGAAMCLAQVGEFSFVLATIAQSDVAGVALISPETFRTMVSATIVSLLITPYFVAVAPRVGASVEMGMATLRRALPWCGRGSGRDGKGLNGAGSGAERSAENDSVFVIGFGSVGHHVAGKLRGSMRERLVAIDLNPDNVNAAIRRGLKGQLGDATQRDILDHVGIARARAVVVTLRDHVTTGHLIYLVRDLAPDAFIIARCRFNAHYAELLAAGAHAVVNEDAEVAARLATNLEALTGTGKESDA
jgi:CPA2 family monovalent cation:H+ antiporter-2